MDDLSQTLNQILSDPNSMAQIQNIMGSLGLGGQNGAPAGQNQTPNPAPSPAAALAPLAAALAGGQSSGAGQSSSGGASPAGGQSPAGGLGALTSMLSGGQGGDGGLGALGSLLSGGGQDSGGGLGALGSLLSGGGQDSGSGLGALGSLLSGGGQGGDMAGMVSTIAKIAPYLSKVKDEDDSTRLLLALKPLLSEARRKKIDDALRILQMMKLLPLLKDTGILSSVLGGIL